ncbi:MAG: MCP four helix bundle domain-containing protein, partial [Desulfuromonadales bacterium]|nr:MCP four helix bundle domain-containing protein [Desulfuromonadales bacterium]
MKWFQSLHLGTQLMVSFVFVALITAVVGIFGITKITHIGDADRVLYEKVTVPSSYVAEMSIAFQRVRICLRDLDA